MHDLTSNWVGALATHVDSMVTRALGGASTSTAACLLSCRYFQDITVGELGEILGITGSGAVRLVDRLEADGLIRRQAKDGRTVTVCLTPAGRASAGQLEQARAEAIDDLVSVLEPHERHSLSTVVEKMLHGAKLDSRAARTVCRFCDHGRCDGPRCPVGRSLRERAETAPRADGVTR